mgnify:CR=1 FL=1
MKLLINWKTSLAALVTIAALVGPLTGVITADQGHTLQAVAVSFGLLAAKDFNVTGGSSQQ